MSEGKKYGFYIEEYEDGCPPVRTLATGDGRTRFAEGHCPETMEAILSMSYGEDLGIGTLSVHPEGTKTTDLDAEFQIRFDNLGSIDALLDAVGRMRERFIENNGIGE